MLASGGYTWSWMGCRMSSGSTEQPSAANSAACRSRKRSMAPRLSRGQMCHSAPAPPQLRRTHSLSVRWQRTGQKNTARCAIVLPCVDDSISEPQA